MNDKGLSLVFAVVILLIFAVLAAVLTSVVSTDADIAFHEFRSTEAQYVADGGIEYALETGTLGTCAFAAGPLNLGSGSFTVVSQENTATMNGTINGVDDPVNVPLNVASDPTIFTIPGTIKIDSEYLFCTGTGPNSFTGCSRGSAGSTPASHTDANVSQCVVTSTGTVPTGIIGDAQRVVRVTIGQ